MIRQGFKSLNKLEAANHSVIKANSLVSINSEAVIATYKARAFNIINQGIMFKGANLSVSAFLNFKNSLTNNNIRLANNISL